MSKMFYFLEKNKPVLEVPETSAYITHFLPSASNSLILSSPDKPQESSSTFSLPPLLGSLFHELGYLDPHRILPFYHLRTSHRNPHLQIFYRLYSALCSMSLAASSSQPGFNSGRNFENSALQPESRLWRIWSSRKFSWSVGYVTYIAVCLGETMVSTISIYCILVCGLLILHNYSYFHKGWHFWRLWESPNKFAT